MTVGGTWIAAAAAAKRLRDIGWSPWLAPLTLIPVIGPAWGFLHLGCARSKAPAPDFSRMRVEPRLTEGREAWATPPPRDWRGHDAQI